ncbi:hypothetical protein [[Mycobacterium] nativiensis]|uniref:Uncharacterized protein n=1 Tax=[Mycobacterium] nativiensis TaxID=2855503 RepID=A0ABU5Y2W9_9MYCO|nr:hypothetical protein [Mycolicibacter sp. MYC340]MEB3034071.1 hypothetical protein [Mycolicibacter sp. MYC340]
MPDTSSEGAAPTWEDTLPHFAVQESGNRITAPPLENSGALGFLAVAGWVLWTTAGTAAALCFNALGGPDGPAWWVGLLVIMYLFLPLILSDVTAAEARDQFGQLTTAYRLAAVPALAGIATGLVVAALRAGGFRGAVMATAGGVCLIGAGVAALAAWSGIRYTRKRQAWIAWMRQHGKPSPGSLRQITFRKKWSDGNPQFRVLVEFAGPSGPQQVTANMVTTSRRVPLTGTPVVVTQAPQDPAAEPLIDLDQAAAARFDPNFARYEQPTGN